MKNDTVPSGSSAQRWSELSSLYKEMREKNSELAFRMGRFAANLRQAVIQSCGCGEESVQHYLYTPGYVPEQDQSERVDSPHDSITATEEGFVLGIGVQLEISPNSHPKTVLVFPVNITNRPDGSMLITSGMFEGEESTHPDSYEHDVQRLGERIFDGLRHSLNNWIAGERPSKSIGFHQV